MKKIYILIICSLLQAALHAQDGFGTYLRDVIQKQEKGILVTAKLIEACGLCDSLDVLMDYEYEKRYLTGQIRDLECMTCHGFSEGETGYAPTHRKYGYTLFAESDELWESLIGKQYTSITADDVRSYLATSGMFPSALNNDDYQNEDNVLRQFVTYHLLPHRLSPDKLVNHINEYGFDLNRPQMLAIPVTEYYVTMGKRRLLRTYESKESNGVYLNRFPKEDRSRQGTGHEVSCDADKEGIYIDRGKAITWEIPNAVIYPISKLLAYTEDVANQLGSIRLRFDIAGLFPEFSNNDIRLKQATGERYKHVYVPNAAEYPYLDDMTINDESYMVYYNAWNDDWCNLNRDEIKIVGRYDVTLRLPPVPRRGVYELRYKILSTPTRGVSQIYFGSDKDNLSPTGMPIDLRKGFRDSQYATEFGWQRDSGDDYADQMTDNELYHNKVMKGAKSINSYDGSERDDNDRENIRHILIRQTLDPDKTYYLRFKSILDSDRTELYMDYIELCPKEVYDNPNEPEDIW